MADDARRVRRDRSELDVPRRRGRSLPARPRWDDEAFGRLAERFARFMGTGRFIVYMTTFVVVWLLWNTVLPEAVQFDPRELNFTLLTLILSLQASYAAPLILLAQNRQADRDRVTAAQDRAAQERNLADTDFITREVAALKISLREVATRDFLRSELRAVLEDLDERATAREREAVDGDGGGSDGADGAAGASRDRDQGRGRDGERPGRGAAASRSGG